MSIDPALLAILACPACRAPLTPVSGDGLACAACGRVYPVCNGIPVLLVEKAVPQPQWEATHGSREQP